VVHFYLGASQPIFSSTIRSHSFTERDAYDWTMQQARQQDILELVLYDGRGTMDDIMQSPSFSNLLQAGQIDVAISALPPYSSSPQIHTVSLPETLKAFLPSSNDGPLVPLESPERSAGYFQTVQGHLQNGTRYLSDLNLLSQASSVFDTRSGPTTPPLPPLPSFPGSAPGTLLPSYHSSLVRSTAV